MDIKDLLKNLDKNLITEETANAIASAFENAVSEKVKDRVTLAVEKALLQQDEDHADKLKHILERTDEDHCRKLEMVVQKLNESHAKKLDKISNFYKKSINEKASNFSNKLVKDLDKFLSVYLEKKMPVSQLQEAVENTHARKQLEQIRKIVSFDPSLVSENVKSVVKEGKEKIDKLTEMLEEANQKNLKLSSELSNAKSKLFLESKTKGMPSSKKEFIVNLLEDKDVEYIKENFNYVVEMFENGEQEESKVAAQEVKSTVSRNIPKAPKASVVSESLSVNANVSGDTVGGYLSELVRLTK